MKAKFSLLVFALTVLLLLAATNRPDTHAQSTKQKGISYATWWSGQYSTPDADLALSNLAATGADWISLIVTGYQDNITSTTIYTTTATPTDADLIHVITQAHSLGLKVMLKPHVDLENDPSHWRGEIGQGFTETQWAAWFVSYQTFINHYAQLAEAHGAEQFCIGTELSATENQASDWRTVITGTTGVRSRYHGPITYAANWGSETGITWWDAVDYIGVDAYYPLTTKNDPTVAELEAAWQPYSATLAALSSTWGKQVLFTEIGYRSQDGTNQHPGDWQSGGTVDLQEQAEAYRAAFETVYSQPWFAGMFWWSWGIDPFEGGECNDDYTPHDKPAEDMLRAWYGASPRPTQRQVPQPDYSRTVNVYTDTLGSGWEDWSWNVTRTLDATDQVYSGTRAISVTFQGWGGLSLHHSAFTAPYYWLEFYVRGSAPGQRLVASLNDENDQELRLRPVHDCRYIENGTIDPGVWKRVRIPLSHLDATGRSLSRVSIQNSNSDPLALWIDEIRLVAANWPVYLPLVIRD